MNNKLISILIFFILLIITINRINIITSSLIVIILLFLIIKKQYNLLIINLFISIIIIINFNTNKKYECDFNEKFIVYEVHDNYCIVVQNKNKFLLYQDDNILYEGNKIKVNGRLKEIKNNGIPYLYSFGEYLNNKNIYYEIDYYSLEVIDESVTIQNKIINYLLDKIIYSREYLNLLLFNNKSDSISDFYDDLIKISAIQLFVISGFHISFINNVINKVLSKITKKKEHNLTIIILFFYVYLLKFTLSSLRAFLSILFNKINRHFKLNLNSLDINSLIAIIFLTINPKNLFLVGFQLSFIIVIAICMLNSIKSKMKKYLMIIIPFLISLPIILNMNGNIGMINIFMNYILTPIVCMIYLLGIIVLIIPSFDKFLFYIIFGFEYVINLLSKYNFYIQFPYISLYGIIIYYIIIYFITSSIYMKNKKNLIVNSLLLFSFIVIWYNKPFSCPYIMFFDVGQGDACLIHGANNKYNILIDTGGNTYNDIAQKKLIPYFNKEGIKYLDLVIISHLDFDHYGALDSLNNNFKINKIIKDNNYKNIYFNDINFQNLNQFYKENDDENTKSSVLLFDFIGLRFLLTGDAPTNIEKQIINDYEIDIDVLKVGHHGSNTSTSMEFIKSIKPEVAIISVGNNNIYGHPHDEVINRLIFNKIYIFRTDQDGSIKINKNIFNEIIISTKL